MIVESALLRAVPNLRHGFSTREGGVSRPPYHSLNLGPQVGDDPAAVAENRRRFVDRLSSNHSVALAEAHQVHGARVLAVERAGDQGTDADALATGATGVAVAVRTADCAPTRPGQGARLHLDLVALLVEHLARAGLDRARVEVVGGSTTDGSRYFSHRRDRGVTGRHLSAIALVPEATGH